MKIKFLNNELNRDFILTEKQVRLISLKHGRDVTADLINLAKTEFYSKTFNKFLNELNARLAN